MIRIRIVVMYTCEQAKFKTSACYAVKSFHRQKGVVLKLNLTPSNPMVLGASRQFSCKQYKHGFPFPSSGFFLFPNLAAGLELFWTFFFSCYQAGPNF